MRRSRTKQERTRPLSSSTHERRHPRRHFLRDMAIEKETITQFVRPNSATCEFLNEEAGNAKDSHLQDLLPFGFATHHAGMSREDCTTVEDLCGRFGARTSLHCYACMGYQSTCTHRHYPGDPDLQSRTGSMGRTVTTGRTSDAGTCWEASVRHVRRRCYHHEPCELQYYLSLMNQQLPRLGYTYL